MARHQPPLRLSDRFTHLVYLESALLLVEDVDWVLIEDASVAAVLRRLTVSRSVAELVPVSGGITEAAMIHFMLDMLRDQDVVQAVPENERPSTADGPRLLEGLLKAWSACDRGVAVTPSDVWDGTGTTTLVLSDDYLRPGLMATVSGVLASGAAEVLLARVGAKEAWVGPVVGRDVACLACLRRRLAGTTPARTLLHQDSGSQRVVTLEGSEGRDAASLSRITSVLRRGGADMTDLRRQLVRSTHDGVETRHPVPSFPECAHCGELRPASRRDSRVEPPTARLRDGGYRSVEPRATWAAMSRNLDPLTGVAIRIERVELPFPEMHVYTAQHVLAEKGPTIASLRRRRYDQAGGKGRSDIQARVSALCESLERYSGMHRGTEAVEVARASELDGRAWRPNRLLHFSERQFDERAVWNSSQAGSFQLVPRPYDDEAIEWCEADDLVTGETRFVPASYVYSEFRGLGAEFCRADSNGLSAGNTVAEAILQGFFELVERDAVALWWYNRVRRPSFEAVDGVDPWARAMVAAHGELGRDVWTLDLTTDFGIPVAAAVSAARNVHRPEIIFGFGAHLDADVALTRAFTELNQMLPSVLQDPRNRKRQLLPDFADVIAWWRETRLEDVVHLVPSDEAVPAVRRVGPSPPSVSLAAVVEECVARTSASGMPFLVRDLTRGEVGLPVVRVIVPGLRHFWRRLGPGRLYDVPVRLGWLAEAVPEERLNPVSVFV